jgi:hypothetical protein
MDCYKDLSPSREALFKLKRKGFEEEIAKLHAELVKLQLWVKHGARCAHINPYGKYRFNVEAEFNRKSLRPLRQPNAAFA